MRSANASIVIPELQLTLPSSARGQLTTVEGLIRDIVSDLSTDQPLRRVQDEESYTKIQSLIDKLIEILGDDEVEDEAKDDQNSASVRAASEKDLPMPAFTVKLDDPSGNSWIEFIGSMSDPKWNMRNYPRTLQQNIELGLVAAPDESASASCFCFFHRSKLIVPVAGVVQGAAKLSLNDDADEVVGGGTEGADEEIYVFPGTCSSCGHPLDTMMKKVNIPYFKVRNVLCRHASVFIPLIGYNYHVYELRSLRVSRQRSQVRCGDFRAWEAYDAESGRPRRSQPGYPQGHSV